MWGLTGFASAAAFADCPAVSSIERYVESSHDALVALEGSLPADQYLDLENRYAALVVMEWQHIGLNALENDDDALLRLSICFRDQACGADGSDPMDAQITDLVDAGSLELWAFHRTLTTSPSQRMLEWAEIELGCRSPEESAPEEDVITSAEPEREIEADIEPVVVAEPPAPSPIQQYDPQDLIQTATNMLEDGELEQAISPLRNTCLSEIGQKQSSIACDTLLQMYDPRNGQGTARSIEASFLSFSEEICDGGYIKGCQNMADHLRASGLENRQDLVLEFTSKSCDLGDASACATLAHDHIEGRATKPDLPLARQTLKRSCDLGRLESCREVADLYMLGIGGDVESELALNAIASACPREDATNPELCVSAADFVLINMRSGEERAMSVRDFYSRACDLGHDIGCASYAENLELGIGGQADPEGARQARLVACVFGDTDSCRPRS